MSLEVEVLVRVCRLHVNSYLHGSIIQNMGAQIHEGKLAVFLRFDGEFDVWIDAVYVFSEFFFVVFLKYGECVVHVS